MGHRTNAPSDRHHLAAKSGRMDVLDTSFPSLLHVVSRVSTAPTLIKQSQDFSSLTRHTRPTCPYRPVSSVLAWTGRGRVGRKVSAWLPVPSIGCKRQVQHHPKGSLDETVVQRRPPSLVPRRTQGGPKAAAPDDASRSHPSWGFANVRASASRFPSEVWSCHVCSPSFDT